MSTPKFSKNDLPFQLLLKLKKKKPLEQVVRSYICFEIPCGFAAKESTCSAGDLGWEDPLEISIYYPLQYSGLENSMDYRVHGVTKSRTRMSDFHLYLQTCDRNKLNSNTLKLPLPF